MLGLEIEDPDTDLEDQELTGIDMAHLEQAYRKHQLYTIPPDQLRKVHKVFINSSAGGSARANTNLGIQKDTSNEQRKPTKEERQKTTTPTHSRRRQIFGQLRPNPFDLGELPSPPTPIILMKILSWNIRGLNAKSKQDLLKDRIKKDQPDILLLQETKCAGIEANITIQRCWKQAQYVEVDARGAAGGFAILWNPTTVLLNNFFYLQMDHYCVLSPHRLEQTRLHHKCLWPPQTREQGSLSTTPGMDRRAFGPPALDPCGRLQYDHRAGGEKGRPPLARQRQHKFQ
jgi:hypothetical protein